MFNPKSVAVSNQTVMDNTLTIPPTSFIELNYNLDLEKRLLLKGKNMDQITHEKNINRVSVLEMLNGFKTLTPIMKIMANVPNDDQVDFLSTFVSKSELFSLQVMELMGIPDKKASEVKWIANVLERIFAESLPESTTLEDLYQYEINPNLINQAVTLINQKVENGASFEFNDKNLIKDGNLRIKLALSKIGLKFANLHKEYSMRKDFEKSLNEIIDFLHNKTLNYVKENTHELTSTNDKVQLYTIAINDMYEILAKEWELLAKRIINMLTPKTVEERRQYWETNPNGVPLDDLYKEVDVKLNFLFYCIKEIRPNVKHIEE